MLNGKSVSLCMVIWNSSDLTERAINSVRPIIDEIVIVDQGSDDVHSEKLKSLANIYVKVTNKGNADYDRQYCYSLATSDYILAMDADELVSETNLEKLKKLADYNFEVAWFQFVNKVTYKDKTVDLEKLLSNDPHPRLWKRLISKNGAMVSPIEWPQVAHTFPNISSTRIVFCDAQFDHIRELTDIIKTHLHRGKNIDSNSREVEKKFVRAVLNEFGLTSKKQMTTEFPELVEYLK